MNTAGAHELAYASRAILNALLDEIISKEVLTAAAVSKVLDRSVVSLQSLGNLASVTGAITVIKDIRTDLAKHGV
jgi:hypothetical protein